MPKNIQKKRIDDELAKLKDNKEIQQPLFDKETPAAASGEMFQLVADCVEDLGQIYVQKAFSDAGLSPENPFHWGYLMLVFAEAHYHVREGGRRATRTPDYTESFLMALETLARENPGAPRKKLFEEFVSRFGGQSPFKTIHKSAGVKNAYYELRKK